MKSLKSEILSWLSFSTLLFFILIFPAHPQSQALDAQIEGIVTDIHGSLIRGSVITAINIETGARRMAASGESGTYRFPILSLGTYSVIAEQSGFKRFERHGVALSTGQTASVTIIFEPGTPAETVIVTSDTAIADATKVEIGRLVNSRDVKNLPLISRNPFNFMLLQPGVNGRMVGDPSVVRLSANGLRRRVGYQVDGGYNNDANLAGFRLTFISETLVKEVQLLSSGYSAEFGNTAGAVVNVVTPSGTNNLDGSAAFLYRPAKLSAQPFGFRRGDPDPNLEGNGITATLGGPIISDRWHFYGGYEWARRNTASPVTVSETNRAALIATGLPASIFINGESTIDDFRYFLLRTDAKISEGTRVNFRYNRFDPKTTNFGLGRINTTQRSVDRSGYDHAIAAQSVTSFSATFFNEFRFQYAKGIALITANDLSASGASVSINNIANFGPNAFVGTIALNQSTNQFQNSVTKVFNSHSIKIGGGINFIRDRPTEEVSATYIFQTIEAYAAALNGTDRSSYTRYQETFGDHEIPYRATFLNFFVQNDWKISRRLKLAIGLRYDLYLPPKADPDSPLPYSRKFGLDANNFAPRLGVAYLLRDGKYRTVLRAGSGMHYDPPLLRMYRRAILNNGNPRYFSFSFEPGGFGAPEFPNKLGVFPTGALVPPRDIDAVTPDFRTMYAVHSNIQIEQALTDDMSLTAGYLYSIARHIPVTRNINCLPTGRTLADGRPIYGTLANACSNPVVPEFRLIMMSESAGNLNYHAMFLQLTKRFSNGFQLGASYTLSRARDDAPEENGPGAISLSDPSNRAADSGAAYGDVTSVFTTSLVARPKFSFANRFLDRLLNDNQIGLIVLADSGETFNITTIDLNRDGVLGPDRPAGIPRNSGRMPPFVGVDARYSRFFNLNEKLSFEFYAEAANVFNIKQVSGYAGTSLPSFLINTATGELRVPLPDFKNVPASWHRSREIQFGAKLHF
ncbi:MAG: carboxypeptidase regulatory-like domain-containing protein [Pyrinomonadaceae bacterium]